MHELSVIEGIVEAITEVAEVNRLTSITEVNLVIGKLQQLIPEMLELSFMISTKGTMAENSKLVIEWKEIRIQCCDCHSISEISDPVFICPNCGSFNLNILSGKELFIESLIGE